MKPLQEPESVEGPSDAVLVERSLKGEDEAFGKLVDRYQQALYRFLYHLTSHREEAEDLVQEVFVRVYFALPKLRDRTAFRPWLYRIAANRGRTWQARRPPEVASLDEPETLRLVEEQASDPSPEEEYAAQERRARVWQAIHSLPHPYRLPLVLHYFENLSYPAIAEILGVPRSTVDVRLRKAREMLRRKLIDL
jgi:RNA polymerase sigma-70 factor (ECF subfamily)